MKPAFQTLLLTGAAGTVGRALMPALQPLAQRLRVSDLPGPLTGDKAIEHLKRTGQKRNRRNRVVVGGFIPR